jgi:hypothetical protein
VTLPSGTLFANSIVARNLIEEFSVMRPNHAKCFINLFAVLCSVWTLANSSIAQSKLELAAIDRLEASLTPSTVDQIQEAKTRTISHLADLNADLNLIPLGDIYRDEYSLLSLSAHLQAIPLDINNLQNSATALRKVTPGKLQRQLHQLDETLSQLITLLRSTELAMPLGHDTLKVLRKHAAHPSLRSESEGALELRKAFAQIANIHPDTEAIHNLQNLLSQANTITLIRRRFIDKESQGSFVIPVDQTTTTDGTKIHASGKVKVNYRVELPTSPNDCSLLLNVTGSGDLVTRAVRNNISISAALRPGITGTQSLRIKPTEIQGAAPTIHASLQTQVLDANVNCFLGRLPIVERLLSRIVQRKLDENAPKLSDRVETDITKKAEEVGYQLAYRINDLLRHKIWDRFHILTFEPRISIFNDPLGIHYSAHYMMHDQLAALSPPPELPNDTEEQLDIISQIHESAVTNALSNLPAFSIDEATMRGIWQVQLKMEHPSWNIPHPATIPSVIHLRTPSPLSLSLDNDQLILTLHGDSYQLEDQPPQTSHCDILVIYRVDRIGSQIHLVRKPFEFVGDIPEEQRLCWGTILDRMLPDQLHPLPRFQQVGSSSFIQLKHLQIDDGWLVIGQSRQTVPTPSHRYNTGLDR